MITTKELHEAITECIMTRNPNANTCIKLAAYYTILDKITETEGYASSGYRLNTGSEFAQIVNSKDASDIWPVMDALMDTLQAVNPKLYDQVMRQLKGRG